MRVMLAKALELSSIIAEHALEKTRLNCTWLQVPHLINEFRVSHEQPPIGAQWILVFFIEGKLELSIENKAR